MKNLTSAISSPNSNPCHLKPYPPKKTPIFTKNQTSMKNILFFITFLAASHTFAQSKDTLVVQTKVYCDHCVKCETCWPKIEEKLNYTKGIKYVWYDEEKVTISVVYNPKKTNPDNVRKAISDSGFDADNVPANPQGVAELDGCCKRQ